MTAYVNYESRLTRYGFGGTLMGLIQGGGAVSTIQALKFLLFIGFHHMAIAAVFDEGAIGL